MAVGPLAGQGDEELAGPDQRASRRRRRGSGRSERARSRPPVRRTRSSAVRAGRRPRRRGRRVDVGHGRQCRTGRASPVRRPGRAAAGRSGSRSGVVMASVAIRRNSSNDITGISRWPTRTTVGVPSSIRIATTRSGTPCLAADVADERVVEQVDLPGAAAVVRLRVPDLGRAGLAADVVARDERPVAVERHRRDDVLHQARSASSTACWSMTSARGRRRRSSVADRLDDVRLDQRPAVHQRGVGRRELDRRDRDALAERAVGEVDLAPRRDRRVADEAGRPRRRRRCPVGCAEAEPQSTCRTGSPTTARVVLPRPRATLAATTLRE